MTILTITIVAILSDPYNDEIHNIKLPPAERNRDEKILVQS